MRKIILCLCTSYDGFIEGPNDEIDWITFDEEAGDALGNFVKGIDTILYGRVSYEKWGLYHPGDDASASEKSLYAAMDTMTKYVFSTTHNQFEGSPMVVQSNIKETIEELKQQPGKNIWLYGGASLITTFMNLDLVDEYQIAVMPIILGQGKPLFKDIQSRHPLKLLKAKAGKTGALELVYERAC